MKSPRHQVLNSQAITASGNSGYLANLGVNGVVAAILDIIGPVTGTTPSITVSIGVSMTNGGRVSNVFSFAAQTAVMAAPLRNVLSNILEPYIYISWVVTGTTPSFSGVALDVNFI